ncbi:GDP-mannose 4,6 dehydratase 1 [Dionaea muscipula]
MAFYSITSPLPTEGRKLCDEKDHKGCGEDQDQGVLGEPASLLPGIGVLQGITWRLSMWMMLQQDKADEDSHTVEELLEVAFGFNWRDHACVDNLKGDATKAKKVLGWKPKVGCEQLVKMMVDEDMELAKREKVLVDAGWLHGCSAATLI